MHTFEVTIHAEGVRDETCAEEQIISVSQVHVDGHNPLAALVLGVERFKIQYEVLIGDICFTELHVCKPGSD